MTTPNLPDRPVIRRRSDGTVRHDLTPNPDQSLLPPDGRRKPIRVVGRHIPAQRQDPDPAYIPGHATGIAHTTSAFSRLVRVVLPRYLVAGLLLAVTAWWATGLLWVTVAAFALPLPGWIWYANKVRQQARDYRRGLGPPPPGWAGF